MRIVRIEIDGFKSYGTLQSLEQLDPQFNAITGLNGSGKSNVLDSICFLLGITQLQYIRAESTEDLIYKKGLGGVSKATVSITFDNTASKNRPVGYESDKEIVVKKQLILNGKQTYHINGAVASAKKVADLFNSCALNVNNPHFLIMQGRVTKVLNMKPKEILLMVEEAAGVRLYENKKRVALNTIEKKDVKFQQMNKMMDEEILPRLQKLRDERELFNEYNKLGRDVENLQRIEICLDFWVAEDMAKKMEVQIRAMVDEHEAAEIRKQELDEDIAEKMREVEQLKGILQSEMLERKGALQLAVDQRRNDCNDLDLLLIKKLEKADEIRTQIADAESNNKADKERLDAKWKDLESSRNKHGNEAQEFLDAQQSKERCEAQLNALERGLVTDEEGREVSLQQQLLDCRSKLSAEESKARVFRSRLDDLQPELKQKEGELRAAGRRSNSVADLERAARELRAKIEQMEGRLNEHGEGDSERSALTSERHQLATERVQLEDKQRDSLRQYHFLHFDYRAPAHFDHSQVVGVLAKQFTLQDPQWATAIETALGGTMQHVVVESKETAKLLLSQGQLQRRTTFIPLDNLNPRSIEDQRFKTAQRLVGAGRVHRALDLVKFDSRVQKAMQFALGQILVCAEPEDAKKVCFHKEVRARVVTIDGDDYRPDGYLSGGARAQRSSCLTALDSLRRVEKRVAEIEGQIGKIDERLRTLVKARQERDILAVEVEQERVRLHRIQNEIRADPVGLLQERVEELRKKVGENEAALAALQPTIALLRSQVQEMEDQHRNEQQFRADARRKAEKGLREAEAALQRLKGDSAKGREQLKLLELDVQTLQAAIEEDEQKIAQFRQQVDELQTDIAADQKELEELRKREEEAKKKYNAIMGEFREQEQRIRTAEEYANSLRRTVRDIVTAEEKFEEEHTKAMKRQADSEKAAREMEKKNSWITEEKEHFNKPGTQYDFQTLRLTPESVRHRIHEMREKRLDLERRVNVTAMKSLTEEEQRVEELDNKRRGLEADKNLLQEAISEIDNEKRRELSNACSKISRDFGGIFSTLLPGAQSRLEPVNAQDLTAGLHIRVGFNGTWKEGLDELSGGQRSLVALSLILAMLKCNPAPIYILDEVDAALDVNHTTNVGTMIRQHFRESQFIIVSLKEGMFNNANVIYRTQFVNGTSCIRRTVPHIQGEEEEEEEEEEVE